MKRLPSSALFRALELAQAVAGGRSTDEVLEAILDSALELTQGERGFVVLSGGPDLTTVRAARNYGRRGVPVADSRVSGSIVGRALEGGETVVVSDALEDPRFATRRSVRELGLRSVLAAPLKARGRMLGAVVVEDRRRVNAFGAAEKKLVEMMAAHAALALDATAEREGLERDLAEARAERLPGRRFERLVGSSPAFSTLLGRLERTAASDATVLLEGESGTGKELVARTIHEHGRRKEGPFVAVNVAEVPESLLEAELFGHAKGAFTGATAARTGLVAQASSGTLFLDEVGDIPRPIQGKLLRFLQERTVRAVGSGQTRKVDVRVVAATNRDLLTAVRRGDFREDLYFRLNVVRLELPPLRARREDVGPLASHFLALAAAEQGARPRVLSREALEALERHPWPGNVRELENAVRRALVLGNDPIRSDDFALGRERQEVGLAAIEREAALRALAYSNGSITRAARALGIHRATLYRKLRAWGLSGRPGRDGSAPRA
jgi:DNA-binding NtrC family response regulator